MQQNLNNIIIKLFWSMIISDDYEAFVKNIQGAKIELHKKA